MSDGFRLNFTDQEASSEAREFSTLPSGSYLVAITDAELKEVGEGSKNAGKPMANFQFTVQADAFDGRYVGQQAWALVMLFEGALYSAAQMMKAVGLDPRTDEFPGLEEWLGKELVIVVAQTDAMAKNETTGRYTEKKYEEVPDPTNPDKMIRRIVKRAEVKGYKHPSTWKKPAAAGGTKGSTRLPV
jgi:hypothetical protein